MASSPFGQAGSDQRRTQRRRSNAGLSPELVSGASNPDGLFRALDGRNVDVLGSRRRIKIYSVRDEDGRRWVQLELVGRRSYMVTLKLAASDGAKQALMELVFGQPGSLASFAPVPTTIH
jgi:hypothetical protein